MGISYQHQLITLLSGVNGARSATEKQKHKTLNNHSCRSAKYKISILFSENFTLLSFFYKKQVSKICKLQNKLWLYLQLTGGVG